MRQRIAQPKTRGKPRHLAGRLLALTMNGQVSVECAVYDVDDTDAELMEIDENLARADLTPAQETAQIKRREVLWLIKRVIEALEVIAMGYS
jgi:ParB-like chromosome segregation protein Spo0J